MARTQTRTYGVSDPSTRQPLLEAMLRAVASLVSNVVSLSGMIFNRSTRDWHTDAAHEDQLTTSNDTCAPAFILRDDRFAILRMRPVVASQKAGPFPYTTPTKPSSVSVASPPFRSRLDCDPRIICAAVSVPTSGRACRARVRCLSGRRFSDRTRDPIPADAHGLDGWDL